MKLKPILTFFLCFAGVYFAAAFINAEIDFTKWEEGDRFATIFLAAGLFAMIQGMINDLKP